MNNPKNSFTVRTIEQLVVFIVLVPFLPLLISLRWDWRQAWVYGLVSVLGFVPSRLLVTNVTPTCPLNAPG